MSVKQDLQQASAIGAFALAKLVFHTIVNRGYGFHRDELATLDDARHLALGYVAYPPFTPFIGRIELLLFGESLAGFRFFAALAQSIAIVLAALLAKRLGGDNRAQWLAALAVAISPVSMSASALFQYVSFDYLWWVVIAFLVVRLVETDDGRWWLAIGAAIGLGFLTKYTILFLVAGLLAGMVLTPLRRHLGTIWPWAGAAVALLVAAPNIIWQIQHDFISLEMLRTIHERDIRIGRTNHFLLNQLFVPANLVTIPLWIAGLVTLFRRQRVLAWMAVVPFLLFLLARGRDYYTAPIYPMLFAAGSLWLARRKIVFAHGGGDLRSLRRIDGRTDPAHGAGRHALVASRAADQRRSARRNRLAGDGRRSRAHLEHHPARRAPRHRDLLRELRRSRSRQSLRPPIRIAARHQRREFLLGPRLRQPAARNRDRVRRTPGTIGGTIRVRGSRGTRSEPASRGE